MSEVVHILDPDGPNEKTLTEDEISRHTPVKTHTGKGTVQATYAIPLSEIKEFAQRQDRLNISIDGDVKWTGYLIDADEDIRQGQTRIKGDGIAKRLEETRPDYDSLGGNLTYQNIAVEDAIRDYWERSPFFSGNITVYDQPTETVATDAQAQFADSDSEFTDIVEIPSDAPFVVENGALAVSNVSHFLEGENSLGTYTIVDTSGTGVDYSNFEAVELAGTNESVEAAEAFEHDVPAGEIDIRARASLNSFDGTVAQKIDGSVIDETSYAGTSADIDWRFALGGQGPALDAGNHDYAIEITSWDAGSIIIDCWSILDQRFSFTFDNTVDTTSYTLEGPEEFPAGEQISLNTATTSFNITEATVNVTEANSETINEIAVSSDQGSTYQTSTGSNSATFSITDPTRRLITRFELGGYQLDETTSPTNRDAGHAVDVYELLVDGDNLVVIDELELSRNHFDNLQELHDYGNYQWTILHSEASVGSTEAESYYRGDQTIPKPEGLDDPENQNPTIQSGSYFNSIYLQGAEDANGDRPTAELKDQDAIDNDNREISPGVLRDPKVTTEAGATFRARSLLETALSNNDLIGSVTIPPTEYAHPGYAVPVDFGEGEQQKVIEEVRLTESNGQAQITYDFTKPNDLSDQITELRRQSRGIGDKV